MRIQYCYRALVVLFMLSLVIPFRTSAQNTTIQSTIVLQTDGAPVLEGTFQVVSNAAGYQTYPHIDCELATYTSDNVLAPATVHFHNLSTGADYAIPGSGRQLLSDISGNRVAYREADYAGDRVMIFDATSQIRTVIPGLHYSNPAIGGNLVAFEDRSSSSGWYDTEISTYDLNTGIVARLTNDSLNNQNVDVSPNGNALVWEKCQTNGFDCAVYAAVQTAPGIFSTRALTGAIGIRTHPSTNGDIAVYVSNQSGDDDIYYQPLVGGAEVHLAIPGDQRFASISGDIISFESQTQNAQNLFDIFAYDIRSGRLYQVTNTPRYEHLSEISICNGVGRIIYSADGDAGFDIYAFTFEVPDVPASQLNDLITIVRGFNLPNGAANSLITKLQVALAAVENSQTATACSVLNAFINECQAQSGNKLTPDQSLQLITSANQIKTNLGCQ